MRLPALHANLHRVDWSFLDWEQLIAATAEFDWNAVSALPIGKAAA